MSKENKEIKGQKDGKNEERDIRMPENDVPKEVQHDKSVRNTEKKYDAESPIDPFEESSHDIIDRAQDNIDIDENDVTRDEFPDQS